MYGSTIMNGKSTKKDLDKIVSNVNEASKYIQWKDTLNLSNRRYYPTKNQIVTLCTLKQNQTFLVVDITKTKKGFCHASADNQTRTNETVGSRYLLKLSFPLGISSLNVTNHIY